MDAVTAAVDSLLDSRSDMSEDFQPMQPSPHSARLPPEVVDHIIDFLVDDRNALRSCSLTCRSWLPRARHHTFRTMRVTYEIRQQCLQLLEDCPDIRPYFQSLHFDAFGTQVPWSDWEVAAFLDFMPNISTLVFKGFSFRTPLPVGPSRHLRELMFHFCSFQSFDILLATLASAGSVDMLSLQDDTFDQEFERRDRIAQRYASSFKIIGLNLVLPSQQTFAIIDALLAGAFYEQVELFGIGLWTDPVDPSVFHRVMNTVSRVRKLRMYGYQGLFSNESSGVSQPMSLGRFPELRMLAFGSRSNPFNLSPDSQSYCMTPIITAVSQVISPHVEEIQLFPQWLGYSADMPLEWTKLMKVVTSDKFPRLKRLLIVASDRMPITENILSTFASLVVSDPKSHGIPRIAILIELITRIPGATRTLYPSTES